MRSGQASKLLWNIGTLLCLCASVFFLVQFFLFYHNKAQHAVEEGKRVIVAVETGEVTIRAPEQPAPPEEHTEEHAATPENPDAPEDTAAEETAPPKPAVIEPVVYDGKARLSVIISGLGLNSSMTETVINLPDAVTLSFSPYVGNLEQWVTAAKKTGHEVLLDLPMETVDYPLHDPGPMAILNDADKAKNIFHLKSTVSAAKGYIGLLTPPDETITKSLATILPLIDELKKQKVVFIYNEKPSNAFLLQEARAIGLPTISHYTVVDELLSAADIDAQLEEVRKQVIDEQKTVLIIGRPYPLTIKRIEAWLKTLKEKHGLEPSPISTIIHS